MRYEDALDVLADRARRTDRQLIEAARIVATADDVHDSQRAVALSVLRDIRVKMWHADKAPPYRSSTLATLDKRSHRLSGGRVLRPSKAAALVGRYKSHFIDVSAVAAASLLVLYLGLTRNVFSDAIGHSQPADMLEPDELLLVFAVLMLGSLWAFYRFQTERRQV